MKVVVENVIIHDIKAIAFYGITSRTCSILLNVSFFEHMKMQTMKYART